MASPFDMPFSKVYPLLIAKAQRKGRTLQEVYAVTTWLTGYSQQQLEQMLQSSLTYGDFLRQAPHPNENRRKIKGRVCGVRLETIDDPLMWELRCLDKLVDDLAKGKPLEKILNPK